MGKPQGILLMAHGVARDVDDIPRYYAHIRGGRPLSDSVLKELVDRYQAIGGHSPLTEITSSLRDKLARHLNQGRQEGHYRVAFGFRHSEPYIADGLSSLAEAPVASPVTGLVLAPHFSAMSIGAYIKAAEEGVTTTGVPFSVDVIRHWHVNPLFLRLLKSRVEEGLHRFSPAERERVVVVFTAHSLPERIVAAGDPYRDQLQETATHVASLMGLRRYETGWQSAGRTQEAWLGPDILDTLRRLHAEGADSVLVCPCGFTSDHLEVLYDLDIEAKSLAETLGMHFERTRSLNDDDAFVEVLVDVLQEHGALRG